MIARDLNVTDEAYVALDLSNPLPPSLTTLSRWTAEPTSIVFLPSQAFIPNAKGYPVLSKACQAFVKGFVKVSPQPVKLRVVFDGASCSSSRSSCCRRRIRPSIPPVDPRPTTNTFDTSKRKRFRIRLRFTIRRRLPRGLCQPRLP